MMLLVKRLVARYTKPMQPTPVPNPAPQQPPQQTPAPLPAVQATVSPTAGTNKTWSKAILLNNYITLAICAGFLIFVDVPILLNSPELADFFYLMLASTFVVIVFTVVDLLLSKHLRHRPATGTDTTILVMSILRNIIAILNVIPYIQLLAILAFFTLIAPAVVITEIILTSIRASQSRRMSPQQPIAR